VNNRLVLCLAFSASLTLTLLSAPGVLAASRPNVLFIVCDDLNNHLSTSAYPHIHTPAIQRFARESLTFRRAYCQYPVCGPSRASFLSGLYPESTGILNNRDDIRTTRPGTVSLPQWFKEHGYWAGSVGKVFHSPRQEPGETAWDAFERFENDELPMVANARQAFEAGHGPITRPKNRKPWRALLESLGKQTRGQKRPGYGPSGLDDAQHKDGKNVRRVMEWLDKKAYGDRPFFIACGIHKPHVPFLAPQKYFDLYPLDSIRYERSPADDWNDIPTLAMVKRFAAFGFELGKENDPLRREYTQAYHACVSFVDAQIGLLLEKLKKEGLWENTLIVFTSDHGYHLGEHFMWGKVTLFEECARVPLIVRVPGQTRPGTTTDGLVELLDLFPTLVELCKLPAPKPLQGASFSALFTDPSGPGKETAYTVVSRGPQLGRSIRTSQWRYAEWGESGGVELYDLKRDPREYTNLASDPKHQEIVAQMRKRLAERKERAKKRR
jgi:iduronate 2-sulfatase